MTDVRCALEAGDPPAYTMTATVNNIGDSRISHMRFTADYFAASGHRIVSERALAGSLPPGATVHVVVPGPEDPEAEPGMPRVQVSECVLSSNVDSRSYGVPVE